MPRTADSDSDTRQVLLEMYAANEPMNQIILEQLDPRAWRAKAPGAGPRDGRTIAAIFVHLHNCRVNWIKRSAPHMKCPAPLDPARSTVKQVSAASKKSSAGCLAMLKDALSGDPDRRVKKFSRGSWSRDWPAGATMFGYMFAHEYHHRGQIIMLAHQLGYRLPDRAAYESWQWDRLWKQLGFTTRPR